MNWLLGQGILPDLLLRIGIRQLNRYRLRQERTIRARNCQEFWDKFLADLSQGPIALHTERANRQHYEVPPAFFQMVLGPRIKYSSAYWQSGVKELDQAEKYMLKLSCQRARLEDGHTILELGCGWGSLSLYMAEQYPRSQITALSNSGSQGEFIRAAAAKRNFKNITVITKDINHFTTEKKYDRIVSIEMFEHMHNYRLLFDRIASWLSTGAKLFVHIFNHRELAYLFQAEGKDNWMGRYFFTGGLMPSRDTLIHFCKPLHLEKMYTISGTHYYKTAQAWLQNMDAHRQEILRLFTQVYGTSDARRWWHYWRIFFIAVAELFNTDQGKEWELSHYRFVR